MTETLFPYLGYHKNMTKARRIRNDKKKNWEQSL